MKHQLSLEDRLAGAKKARTRLEQKVRENPRYRGLLVGNERLISKLETALSSAIR